jgi:hypothetical protein
MQEDTRYPASIYPARFPYRLVESMLLRKSGRCTCPALWNNLPEGGKHQHYLFSLSALFSPNVALRVAIDAP